VKQSPSTLLVFAELQFLTDVPYSRSTRFALTLIKQTF
jgi:hypothetical protein